ncbi:MAG: class IV adenylate cyclase [Bacteroidota bacterium]
MSFINIEIKARTNKAAEIRKHLLDNHAEYKGTDFQTDTYFNTLKGRLKLRQGNIENNLIYYEREDQAGPKQSTFSLLQVTDPEALKSILAAAAGIKITVEKQREIYFIGNIKFHLDTLAQLGNFVEIEASNKYAPLSVEELNEQCNFYMREFGIEEIDLINISYSDMLLERQ